MEKITQVIVQEAATYGETGHQARGYNVNGAQVEKIQETNTCSNLSVPVRVWIDAAGDYAVYVYDGPEKERD